MACPPVLPVRFPGARILIFAKAPVPGRVKTRLSPALGSRSASDLHARLLLDTVARLATAGLAPLELWCAPDPEQHPFPELANRYGLELHRQQGANLGERMLGGATDALRRSSGVILVGTDCPLLDGAYLERALTALERQDAVLGPAEDGGYVLLGLKGVVDALFRGIPWGGDQVATMTRERMEALRWKWMELPALWDVDRPEDLERLAARRDLGGGHGGWDAAT